MDRGTKIYLLFLSVLVAGLLVLFLYEDPQVGKLNALLEQDPELADFPYPFRVVKVDDGVATLSTPRSTEVPVERVLGLLFPQIAGRSPESAEFQQAQQLLALVQTRARDLILDAPDIRRVNWQLDKNWLSQHGLVVNPVP